MQGRARRFVRLSGVMTYALGSLAIGILVYFVTFIAQSPRARRDRNCWGELFFISAILASLLAMLLFWTAMEAGPRADGAAIVEALFSHARYAHRHVPIAAIAGFAFTILAGAHVLVLRILTRRETSGEKARAIGLSRSIYCSRAAMAEGKNSGDFQGRKVHGQDHHHYRHRSAVSTHQSGR